MTYRPVEGVRPIQLSLASDVRVKNQRLISSNETWIFRFVFPMICISLGVMLFVMDDPLFAIAAMSFGILAAICFGRLRHMELSMGKIKIHRWRGDVWIDFQDVIAIHPRFPLGIECAMLELKQKSAIGKRVLFMLERRYVFTRPPLVRPTHPTINVLRTECEEACRNSTKPTG